VPRRSSSNPILVRWGGRGRGRREAPPEALRGTAARAPPRGARAPGPKTGRARCPPLLLATSRWPLGLLGLALMSQNRPQMRGGGERKGEGGYYFTCSPSLSSSPLRTMFTPVYQSTGFQPSSPTCVRALYSVRACVAPPPPPLTTTD
jgi:hypothetical protein